MGHQVKDYSGINISSQPKYDGSFSIYANVSGMYPAYLRRLIIVSCLGIATASCSLSGPKIASLESDASLVTDSVSEPVKKEGIASTDADVIKTTVAQARIKPGSSLALAWANPSTGSSGTIMAIDKYLGKHGQKCRVFKTTVSTFMGIAFYNGEACQISPKEWVLSWFRPSESKG
jgi:surface antigen